MPSNAFVDTNVLLRAFHSTFPEHAHIRAMVERMLDEDVVLWINRQVIRKYLVQATHPRTFAPPLTIDQVLRQITAFVALFSIARSHPYASHTASSSARCNVSRRVAKSPAAFRI